MGAGADDVVCPQQGGSIRERRFNRPTVVSLRPKLTTENGNYPKLLDPNVPRYRKMGKRPWTKQW